MRNKGWTRFGGVWFLLAVALALPAAAQEKGRDFEIVPAKGPLAGKRLYRRSFALLVGINKYPNAPDSAQLTYANADVDALREMLTQHYGFPAENVTILKDGQASLAAIRDALSDLADSNKIQSDDRVLVYFSGHGQTVKAGGGEAGFLIPSDAKTDLAHPGNVGPYRKTCLPMSEVWDTLSVSPARHVLLLVDACYGGLLASSRAYVKPSQETLNVLMAKQARQIMTAGGANEKSWEKPEWGHGAFTFKLLEELKARATLPDTVFTASELHASVQNAVSNLTDGKQRPQFRDKDTEGEFLFLPVKAAFRPEPKPNSNIAPNIAPTGLYTLRMKFEEGAVSRYKGQSKTTTTTTIPAIAETQEQTVTEIENNTAIAELTTTKLLDKGGAEIVVLTKDLKSEKNGMPNEDAKIPMTTLQMDSLGRVLSSKPDEAEVAGIDAKNLGTTGFNEIQAFLPDKPVKIGDKWTQKINLHEEYSNRDGVMNCTLVRLETIDGIKTALIHATLKAPFFMMIDSAGNPTKTKDDTGALCVGEITGIIDINFALDAGKVVRWVDSGNVAMAFKVGKEVSPEKAALLEAIKMSMKSSGSVKLITPNEK